MLAFYQISILGWSASSSWSFLIITCVESSAELMNLLIILYFSGVCTILVFNCELCEGDIFTFLIQQFFLNHCCRQFGIETEYLIAPTFLTTVGTWLNPQFAQFSFIFTWTYLFPSVDWIFDYFIFYFPLIAHKVLAFELTQSLFARPAKHLKVD